MSDKAFRIENWRVFLESEILIASGAMYANDQSWWWWVWVRCLQQLAPLGNGLPIASKKECLRGFDGK